MTITEQALQEMLKRNRQVSIDENKAKGQVHSPEPERHAPPTLVRMAKREASGTPGVTVRFTMHRVRLLDPDNAAGGCKDLLDGLRHSGLISDDDWKTIRLETSQEKVRFYRDQFTDIEVIS